MTDLFHQGKETSLIAHQAGLNVLKSPTHHITHVDNVNKAVSLIKMIKNRWKNHFQTEGKALSSPKGDNHF